MKRFTALLLAAVLFLPMLAAADVLNADWKSASDDELTAAINEINAEMRERKATRQTTGETIVLSGSGTTIESFTLEDSPVRITLTCEDKKKSEPLTIIGGKKDLEVNSYRTGKAEVIFDEIGTFSALVETTGKWDITIEPINSMYEFSELTGDSSKISDIFELTKPIIVEFSTGVVQEQSGSFIIHLLYCDKYRGWKESYESWLMPDLKINETFSYDMILKPENGAELYAIEVISNYPGLEWSIKTK